MVKKIKIPRKLSLVKLSDYVTDEMIKEYEYPFKKSKIYVFLGEIVNMQGHCVVVEYKANHTVYSGYHTDNFVELSEEEV